MSDSTMLSIPADRESLYLMTKLKLDRFKQRKVKYEKLYSQLIEKINDDKTSLADKVQTLHQGIQELFPNEGKERYLTNFDELLTIANTSTSTSNSLLENFYQRLRKIIDGGKRRCEYNYLFGLIMSQWFQRQDNTFKAASEESPTDYLITNERLKAIIFDRPQLDLDNWRNFLENKLFSYFNDNPKLKNVFKDLQNATTSYGHSLLTEKVSMDDVRRAMKGLIASESLSDHRQRLMEKLQFDDNAVEEFASSLTLVISDLTEWNWPSTGVRGVFRRNLSGKYRCYYEEDFLTAVFLEHLGLKWTYHFKRQLQNLFSLLRQCTQKDSLRTSIQYERLEMQRNDFWMASLPDETNEADPYRDCNTNGVSLKAKLLYLIDTEIQLHQTLHPNAPFIVVCADLEWFGPSISHETLKIFLQICGMPDVWLKFFGRFLKQPLFYNLSESIRQRQRGVPISHALSYLFSELLLFGMDLYVYQSTGIFNYRLHDDFWFFDSDLSKVGKAWALMNEYAQMTGLKFNQEKCGSVQIEPSSTADHAEEHCINLLLPQKDVKWGLLSLRSTGRFHIDQDAMKPFLDELKIRLANASTILEWVNLYNTYMAFFTRNFGESANILGTFHTEQIVDTFGFVHRYVFDETNGNALTILTNRIREQFPDCIKEEISEAWIYWPLTRGGLGLKNVYLDSCCVHKQLQDCRVTTFAQLPAQDAEVYAQLKDNYEQAKENRFVRFEVESSYKFLEEYIEDKKKFMTFDEFISRRESCFPHWRDVYKAMLQLTEPLSPKQTPMLDRQMEYFDTYPAPSPYGYRERQDRTIDSYLQWLVCYYGEQIESIFQQLDFIDKDSIPVGLIKNMKTVEIDWDKGAR